MIKLPLFLAAKFPEGVSSLTLETVRYEGSGFTLTATKGSKIAFEDDGKKTVHKSLKPLWTVDPAADPANEKLTITTK